MYLRGTASGNRCTPLPPSSPHPVLRERQDLVEGCFLIPRQGGMEQHSLTCSQVDGAPVLRPPSFCRLSPSGVGSGGAIQFHFPTGCLGARCVPREAKMGENMQW